MTKTISVKVQTKASQNKVLELAENEFKVWVTCVPENGKANQEVIKLLGKFFKTAKSNIELIQGHKSSHKVLKVDL